MNKKYKLLSKVAAVCVVLVFHLGCTHIFVNKDSREAHKDHEILNVKDSAICIQIENSGEVRTEKEIQLKLDDPSWAEYTNLLSKWRYSCKENQFRFLIKVSSTSSFVESGTLYKSIYIILHYGTFLIFPLFDKVTFDTVIMDNGQKIYQHTVAGPSVASILLLPLAPVTTGHNDVVKEELFMATRWLDRNQSK